MRVDVTSCPAVYGSDVRSWVEPAFRFGLRTQGGVFLPELRHGADVRPPELVLGGELDDPFDLGDGVAVVGDEESGGVEVALVACWLLVPVGGDAVVEEVEDAGGVGTEFRLLLPFSPSPRASFA